MASYSSGYNFQYNGALENQPYTNNASQPYFKTNQNQYNSGTTDYQNTGAGNSEDYVSYGNYGTTGNSAIANETNQYYPSDKYPNSYGYNNSNNHAQKAVPKKTYSSGYKPNKNKSAANARAAQNQVNKLLSPNRTDSNSNRSYVPFDQFRQYYGNRQQKPQGENLGAPPLFMGKDASYPDELNALMNPFFCGLCDARLNSIKSANIHYESKAHDRHITAWLKKTYTDHGLSVPDVQRFVSEMSQETPGVYHCELCKLELTSAQHALQHYNGKRHRQAATKVSPPTGIGYFNVEGKWVQTGKLIDKITGKETSYILVKTPTGFEPVVLQVAPNVPSAPKHAKDAEKVDSEEPPAKKPHLDENVVEDNIDNNLKEKQEEQYRSMLTEFEKRQQQPTSAVEKIQPKDENQSADSSPQPNIPQTPVNKKKPTVPDIEFQTLFLQSEKSPKALQAPQEALESLQCKVCGIATTSTDQMLMHLKGARHSKKLKALGERPMVFEGTPATILESLDNNDPSDISIYRTPSGSYYCKLCNAAVEDISRMERHISSKKHLMAVKENDELAPSDENMG